MSYVKLFSDLITSSVWSEAHTTRVVWITMLSIANRDGIVLASVPGLAHVSRVTMEECVEALRILSAPDEHSRTKDHEGRRIQAVAGGWLIRNYEAKRELLSIADRRQTDSARQARRRARLDANRTPDRDMSRDVTVASRSVTPSHAASQIAEAEAEAEAEREVLSSSPRRAGPRAARASDLSGFDQFWSAFGKKISKGQAERAWAKLRPDPELRARIIEQAARYRASIDDQKFQQHPATWLNAKGWENEYLPSQRGGMSLWGGETMEFTGKVDENGWPITVEEERLRLRDEQELRSKGGLPT